MVNTVIIGAGPAGITAAIYLKKANIDFIILEKNMPGGQLNQLNKIDNYPGFAGITGSELAIKMYKHLESLKINYKYGNVKKIITEKTKKIITERETIECKNIIIATGKTPKKINSNLKGISYCATCDGSFYKDKVVALYGVGKQMKDAEKYLSKICKKVHIVNKEEKPLKINGIDQIESIETDNKTIKIDGLFVYLGNEINLEFIQNISKEKGHIIVNENLETNIKGIYAAGDVIKKNLYQISTAISDGALAATSIIKEKNNE